MIFKVATTPVWSIILQGFTSTQYDLLNIFKTGGGDVQLKL